MTVTCSDCGKSPEPHHKGGWIFFGGNDVRCPWCFALDQAGTLGVRKDGVLFLIGQDKGKEPTQALKP